VNIALTKELITAEEHYHPHLIERLQRDIRKALVCLGVISLERVLLGMAAPSFSVNCSLLGTLYHGRNPAAVELHEYTMGSSRNE